jgi:(2R)-3-sulfolactate dehydrogenase (NADP+)
MSLAAIEACALEALARAGAAPHQAAPVARSVVRAEADGIQSVGLGYLPTYLAHLRSGRVDGRARPSVSRPRSGVVLVDAAHGFAHPAFDAGIAALCDAAGASGAATLAITKSYSIGVLGHAVEDIAAQGLVALAMTNSPPNMAAWGGRTKVFGTNPIAFAAPRAGAPPLVVDMATTVVTKVTLAAHAAEERPIPPGWAIDAAGEPTTDARAAMAGAMLPFGGVKGANVALLVGLLAAVLTGAALSCDVHPYADPQGPPPGVGQLFLALDPAAFADGFTTRFEALATAITADGQARLPGDRRLAARKEAAAVGVRVPDALLARITA